MKSLALALTYAAVVAAAASQAGCGGDDANAPPPIGEAVGWTAPTMLGDLGPSAFGPSPTLKLAMDAGGSALALWMRPEAEPLQYTTWWNRDSMGTVWTSRGSRSGWNGASVVASRAIRSDLSMNERGDAVVAWLEEVGEYNVRVMSRRSLVSGWTGPTFVAKSDDFFNLPPFLAVAVRADGSAMLAWEIPHLGTDYLRIYVHEASPDGAWTRGFGFDAGTDQWLGFFNCGCAAEAACSCPYPDYGPVPSPGGDLVIDGTGSAIIVSDLPQALPSGGLNSLRRAIVATRLAPGSRVGSPTMVWNEHLGIMPALSINPAGQAAAVWLSFDPAVRARRVYASTFDPSGGWGPATAIGDWSQLMQPSVAIDDGGRAIALWTSRAQEGLAVESSRFVPEQGWTHGRVTTVDRDVVQSDPVIAMAPQGRAIALFTQIDRDIYRLAVSRYDGQWQEPQFLSSNTVGTWAGAPQIAMNRNGDVVAVWQQIESPPDVAESRYSIWGSWSTSSSR